MTTRPTFGLPNNRTVEFDLSVSALERWQPGISAAATGQHEISMLDPVGLDPWTGEGITANRVSADLKRFGAETPITINMNSPGGDMFEGLAIYNLLREHKGTVTVKVLGLAASAASVIAMAGDEVQIARAGFVMVHNAWLLAIGNRHDLRAIADTLEPFDKAMAGVYAQRTGLDLEDVQALMDAETWIGGEDAVEQGFADRLLAEDELDTKETKAKTGLMMRRAELALRKGGMARSEARRVIAELRDAVAQGQVPENERRAAAAEEIIQALSSFRIQEKQ